MSTFKIIESSWLSFTFCSLWLRRLILVVTPLEMEVVTPLEMEVVTPLEMEVVTP